MVQKVIVAPGEVIVLVKGKEVTRVLERGTHYVFGRQKVERYHLAEKFIPRNMTLQVALQSEVLKSMLKEVDVSQSEVGLVSEKNRLIQVLTSGTHAYWKSELAPEVTVVSTAEAETCNELPVEWLDRLVTSMHVRKVMVERGEVGLLWKDGEFVRTLNAGVYRFWKNNQDLVIKTVSTRIETVNLNGQELLTKDKAAVRLNYTLTYKVNDPKVAVEAVANISEYLYKKIALAIREVASGLSLEDLLAAREKANDQIVKLIEANTALVGIDILDGGLVDVILPGDVKDILNMVLIAEKEAQANVIRRREEMAAVRNSLNSAKLMDENPVLFRLKELELVERISGKVGALNVSGSGEVLEQLRKLISSE
ncbi:MAG: slipin family protein [Bacteroidetes bacterium]|nr:MAG: slipin family protein [Bacteroidota bacterium]